METYPFVLQNNTLSTIVALSDTEIGKVVLPNTMKMIDVSTGKEVNFGGEDPTVEAEAIALQYANTINDLMPKFIRTDTWRTESGKDYDMLVMERLYPLDIHHFDLPIRKAMMDLFELEMKQLHDSFFVHGDFMRPTNYYTRNNLEWIFQNIVQTEAKIRLIDAGFAIICKKDNIKKFVHIQCQEQREIPCFKEYYLSVTPPQ